MIQNILNLLFYPFISVRHMLLLKTFKICYFKMKIENILNYIFKFPFISYIKIEINNYFNFIFLNVLKA